MHTHYGGGGITMHIDASIFQWSARLNTGTRAQGDILNMT